MYTIRHVYVHARTSAGKQFAPRKKRMPRLPDHPRMPRQTVHGSMLVPALRVWTQWMHTHAHMRCHGFWGQVLLGLHEQKALHALCNRLWPQQMKEFSEEVAAWRADPEFAKQIEAWEKEALL